MLNLIIVFHFVLILLFVEENMCCNSYCAEGGMVTFQPSFKGQRYVQVRITRTWDDDYTCTAGHMDDIITKRDKHQYRCPVGECQYGWNHYSPPLRCRNFDMVDGRLMVYFDTDICAHNSILFYISWNPGNAFLWKRPLTKRGGFFRMVATANTSIRTDTGKMNHSPTPLVIPDVKFKHGCQNAYVVPVTDTDNDVVRCRMAVSKNYIYDYDSNECNQLCDSEFRIEQESCSLSYCGNESGTFAVVLQIEDFIDKTSKTPLSSVPLQFIVTITNDGTPCDTPALPCPATPHTVTTSKTATASTETSLPVTTLTTPTTPEIIPPIASTTIANSATRASTHTTTPVITSTAGARPSQFEPTSGNMILYIILAASLGLVVGSLTTVLVGCLYAKRNRDKHPQRQHSENQMTTMQDPPLSDILSDATRQSNLNGYSSHVQGTCTTSMTLMKPMFNIEVNQSLPSHPARLSCRIK